MDRTQIFAAMEAILNAAQADARDLTADELHQYEALDAKLKALDAKLKALDATAERRKSIAALRQGSGPADLAERIERSALRPDQKLAAIFARPQGDTRRMGDMIKGALGIQASQNSGSGPAGGFTVPDFLGAEVLDLARAKSRVIQAGARTVPIMAATSFATVESDPTIRAHSENESITESEIVLGSRKYIPTTRVCLIRAPIELVEDSANFNALVDQVLAASFAVELDRLALYGTGVGQQLGVFNTDGVHEINGATFTTWGPFSRAMQAVRSSNYEPGAFITSPGVLGAIDGLVEGGGSSQPLRRPPSLETAQFLDTTSVPVEANASAAVVGQWDQLFIAMRTPITIEATRTGGDSFNTLSVLVRAYARLDSFAVRQEAFAKVSAIPVPAVA